MAAEPRIRECGPRKPEGPGLGRCIQEPRIQGHVSEGSGWPDVIMRRPRISRTQMGAPSQRYDAGAERGCDMRMRSKTINPAMHCRSGVMGKQRPDKHTDARRACVKPGAEPQLALPTGVPRADADPARGDVRRGHADV
jgi:hypothetical protein